MREVHEAVVHSGDPSKLFHALGFTPEYQVLRRGSRCALKEGADAAVQLREPLNTRKQAATFLSSCADGRRYTLLVHNQAIVVNVLGIDVRVTGNSVPVKHGHYLVRPCGCE